MKSISELKDISKEMRKEILRLTFETGNKGAHIAPSLSMVEIMSSLFCGVMDHEKDVFVLSKGHGGLCYYTALYMAKLITKEQLDTFEKNGGLFPGQPSRLGNPIISYSSGSLGMGLSYAAGLAWKDCKAGNQNKYYVLVGDGELNEGSNWESAMFIKQNAISNIIVIVDKNEMQSDGFSKDILNTDISALWKACGWEVIEADGHNEEELCEALLRDSDIPKVIVANTVKGKGISFMENDRTWHHNHLSEKQYLEALAEVDAV